MTRHARIKSIPPASRIVLCMVTLGVAGCDGAAEADGTATTVPVVTATRVRQLTEAETAGPLFRPDHLSRVGDDLWILDAGNFRIVIRTPDSVYSVGREGDGPGEFRLPLSLSAFERPFDSPPHADVSAACGGLAAVSVGGRRLEIVLLDSFGDLAGEIRDSLRGPIIREQEADAFFSTFFPEALVEEFDLRNLLPVPERHPAVHDLQFTSDGRVWARLDPEYILIEADRREHSRWRVWTVRRVDDVVEISPPSDVLLPHLFTPNEVLRDTIWGVRINELGIHTIEGFVVEDWTGSEGCTAR